MWTTPRTRVTTTLMPLVTLHGRTYFLDMLKISKSDNWVIFQDDFAPLRIIILLFGAIDFWHLEKAAVEACNYKLLMFFSTWRYSEAACFNRALQISDVIQVYFHWWCLWHLSTSWSTTRWGVGFTWSCSVGLYSSLGSTKKYRWVGMSVLNFLKKGNPDVSASMKISCHQKLPDQAL